MAHQKKKPQTTDRQVDRLTGGSEQHKPLTTADRTGANREASKRTQAMAAKVGNQDMAARLRESTDRRDTLLKFTAARLQSVQSRQLQELDALKHRDQWYRSVSMKRPGYTLPDPTRWHDCARLYKQAAEELCRGHLGRGADLLDRALESERVIQRSFPAFLDKSAFVVVPLQGPEAMEGLVSGEGCPTTNMPRTTAKLADEILRVTESPENVRTLRTRGHQGWWEGEEEEEEEDQKKPTGKKEPARA